jgi:hypothetical protein
VSGERGGAEHETGGCLALGATGHLTLAAGAAPAAERQATAVTLRRRATPVGADRRHGRSAGGQVGGAP